MDRRVVIEIARKWRAGADCTTNFDDAERGRAASGGANKAAHAALVVILQCRSLVRLPERATSRRWFYLSSSLVGRWG